jgi:hypothetical protein
MPTRDKSRHLPDTVRRKMKAQETFKGESITRKGGRKIRRVGKRLILKKVLAHLADLSPVNPRVPPAQIIREERDSRPVLTRVRD